MWEWMDVLQDRKGADPEGKTGCVHGVQDRGKQMQNQENALSASVKKTYEWKSWQKSNQGFFICFLKCNANVVIVFNKNL